ncbi:MAG TPA: condensation domain-containing protein, partial [Burkholderiaceae bacterium]|nr:condensation domain-containing protein [Burkholderiaceae bacterium]
MNTDLSLSRPAPLDEAGPAPSAPQDSMENLLQRLRQRGVQLQAEGAQLRVSAPKGALDEELRAALSAGKSEILRLLQSQGRRAELPQVRPQPAQRHQPFPLTDVQHAYWMGRQPFVELGGFSTHCYFEFEREGLNPARLETALQRLIQRHDMLRAVIDEDGTQRVLPEVPPYRIECLDLREQPVDAAESALLAQREQLSHRRGPVDRWPLFTVRAARLRGERLRLFVSLDMLIIDASSMFLFFQEWQQACEDPQRLAPAQSFSYRDYALFEQTLHEQPEFQRARDYWTARLDSLPPAPGLPLARQPHELAEVRFERREQRIAAPDWARLKALAAQHGATPTVLLMTAFAEALRRWSATPDFSLNVTLFHRFPVHPEVDQLIGDFTATTLLAAQARAGDSFADRLQRLQAQLAEDLDHRAYSGMRVLRDRARHLGHAPGAAMPVVFTSTLALDGRQSTTGGLSYFGDIVHGVSQTPQVWMDHQMAEFDGELRLFLDAIEDLFPAGLLNDCFGAYARLLRTLAADPAAWTQRPLPSTLPSRHLPLLAQMNATGDPAIGHGLLQDGLITQSRRQPEALAVIAADGQLSYARLAREAQALAEALQALGAGREQPVAVMMDKGCEQVLAVYGVLMAGAAYLPIDPRLPAERRRHLLNASGARLLLTQAAHRPAQDLTPGLRVLCLGDEAL